MSYWFVVGTGIVGYSQIGAVIESIVRAWTLYDRLIDWELFYRDLGWTLNGDDRDLGWTVEDR